MANTSFNPLESVITGEANESSFKTISAGPVQDGVIADTTTDILNLSAMGSMEIHMHADTDTIVLSAGATTLIYSTAGEISFGAHRNGASQAINSDTNTLVEFDTVEFNIDERFNTTTYSFLPGVSGRYYLTAGAAFDDVANGTACYIMIAKNDSVIVSEAEVTAAGESDPTLTINAVVQAEDTDYYSIAVRHNDPVSRNIYGSSVYTYFQGFRI